MLDFSNNLEENLIQIQNELIWKTYNIGRYHEFFIYEPKKRLIMALPFKDRVVQWVIYRVLNPLLDKRYIKDSYACRVGYGVHRAVSRLQYWLRRLSRQYERVYALKLDISKYFYRVDHNALMGIIRRIINDNELLELLEIIIRCEHTNFGIQLGDHDYQRERQVGVGMPIGNLTSQMFANLYLNELDQFCKHELKIKYYIRYMDDVVILHHDKKQLWEFRDSIEIFLDECLRLNLNNKTTVCTTSQGIDFCGFRVWPTHIKLRKTTAVKMKKRLKYLQRTYDRGEVSLDEVNASVQSYFGLMKHCDSYKLRNKLVEELVFQRQLFN